MLQAMCGLIICKPTRPQSGAKQSTKHSSEWKRQGTWMDTGSAKVVVPDHDVEH